MDDDPDSYAKAIVRFGNVSLGDARILASRANFEGLAWAKAKVANYKGDYSDSFRAAEILYLRDTWVFDQIRNKLNG